MGNTPHNDNLYLGPEWRPETGWLFSFQKEEVKTNDKPVNLSRFWIGSDGTNPKEFFQANENATPPKENLKTYLLKNFSSRITSLFKS